MADRQRFTVHTDPDGRSYLFGRNHPEPDPDYETGGTELFNWSDEAIDALRSVLTGSVRTERPTPDARRRLRQMATTLPEGSAARSDLDAVLNDYDRLLPTRSDGFAGYTSCPSLPCTGTLAANCAASGDCLVGLALLHLNETCDLQRRPATDPAVPVDRDRGDLEELRGLSDAATGGTWRTTNDGEPDMHGFPTGWSIERGDLADSMENGSAASNPWRSNYGWDEADAVFVAACVNYVRARLASPTTGEPEPGGDA